MNINIVRMWIICAVFALVGGAVSLSMTACGGSEASPAVATAEARVEEAKASGNDVAVATAEARNADAVCQSYADEYILQHVVEWQDDGTYTILDFPMRDIDEVVSKNGCPGFAWVYSPRGARERIHGVKR